MTVTAWIDELGRQQAADAVVEVRTRQMVAGCERLALAAHWADLHPGETADRAVPGAERVRWFGADGTPGMGEFAAAELAVLLGTSPLGAGNLVADALDVRHRLPVLWVEVCAGRVWEWQAREVARRTRAAGLSREQAGWVDGQVTQYVASLPWSRLLALLEAKIIEVDPAAAEARRVAAALERFVATGRCNEFGLQTVIAKATAGDAVFFVGMCDRIAACLAADGDTDPVGVRRSKAVGILANPAAALALLVRHAGDGGNAGDPVDPEPSGASGLLWPADLHPSEDDSDDETGAGVGSATAGDPCLPVAGGRPSDPDQLDGPPADDGAEAGDCVGCGHALAAAHAGFEITPRDAAAVVKALAAIDPAKLLPKATLYLHMSRESFDAARASAPPGGTEGRFAGRPVPGVARLEGVGPVTPAQVAEFLGHTHVSVKPVIDLDRDNPVDGYEVPDRMREQLHLRTPACVFPHSPDLARTKDADHTEPYRDPGQGGPPRQTRIANLGLLGRTAHRVKTHARGWVHHQPVPGVFLWRTPHGYWFRVDHTGTHRLGRQAELPAVRCARAGAVIAALDRDRDSPLEQALRELVTAA